MNKIPNCRPLFSVAGLAAVLFFAGCASLTPKEQSAAEEPDRFSKAMRSITDPTAFDAVPVVPQREDVRVGDVFLLDAEEEFIIMLSSHRWANLPLMQQVVDQNAERPRFPPTQSRFFVDSASSASPSSARVTSGFEIAPFPLRPILIGVLTENVGNREMVALLPPEARAIMNETAWSENVEITVRASAAESYSLPQSTVLEAAIGDGGAINPALTKNLSNVVDGDTARFFVVSEVLFTRMLTISIRSQTSKRDEDELVSFDPSPGLKQAQLYNEKLQAGGFDDVPGGEFRFVSVADDRVVCRRIYDQPVAIGVRGFVIDLNPESQEIYEVSLTPRMRGLRAAILEAVAEPTEEEPTEEE